MPIFLRRLLFFLCLPGLTLAAEHIVFIPKGATHTFWREMARGAEDAARELQLDLTWRGPSTEDAAETQAKLVQFYVSQKFNGIILAPNSPTELVAALRKAAQSGVRVVIVDSPLHPGEPYPYIGTDNRKAGMLAAERAAREHPGARKVLVLRYSPEHRSTVERENGFIERISQLLPKARIAAADYTGATVPDAEARARQLLGRERDVDLLFTPNESSTEGAILALRGLKLAGKVHLYGFDFNQAIHTALRDGTLDAVVIQDPYLMGRESVKLMHGQLQGKAGANRETPAGVIGRAELDTPETRRKTEPFLIRYKR